MKKLLTILAAAILSASVSANTSFVKVQNGTLEQFLNGNGDYFISFADQQTPQVLKSGTWPPNNALFSMYVENVPMATFLKRPVCKCCIAPSCPQYW